MGIGCLHYGYGSQVWPRLTFGVNLPHLPLAPGVKVIYHKYYKNYPDDLAHEMSFFLCFSLSLFQKVLFKAKFGNFLTFCDSLHTGNSNFAFVLFRSGFVHENMRKTLPKVKHFKKIADKSTGYGFQQYNFHYLVRFFNTMY